MNYKKLVTRYAILKLCKQLQQPISLLAQNNDHRFDFMLTNRIKYAVFPHSLQDDYLAIQKNSLFNKYGIDNTEAEFYIFVIQNNEKEMVYINDFEYYMISVRKLKQLIENQYYVELSQTCFKSVYLFNFDIIKKNSARL